MECGKKYLGHTDMELLPDAEEELVLLSEQCRHLTWDAVYCSDLLRCRQTLAHIAPQVIEQVKLDSRLRENDFGQWEGLNYEQLKDNLLYRSWIDDPQKVTPPEGEAWQLLRNEWILFCTNRSGRSIHTKIHREHFL